MGERRRQRWTLTGLPLPKVALKISLWLEERGKDPFAFWPRMSVDIEPIWEESERKREGAREGARAPPPLPPPPPLTPSGRIDCCLFLFVHLFSVTAVKREAGGGMNAWGPPGRERRGPIAFVLFLSFVMQMVPRPPDYLPSLPLFSPLFFTPAVKFDLEPSVCVRGEKQTT